MRKISFKALFGISLLAGMAAVIASSAYAKWQREADLPVKRLSPNVAVTEQITLQSILRIGRNGYAAIVDLRPDGEAPDQPASKDVAAAAAARGMKFFYVPVPHGPIPDEAVNKLNDVLAGERGPILLYCRSGSRAARTWSLVEASRPGGLDAPAILATVKAAGLSADDLAETIQARIAHRRKSEAVQ